MSADDGAYTFGDSRLAAERLALLAEVFEPTTRALLDRTKRREPALVVDLGSGPGHTSELLAEVLVPHRLLAVDSSPAFVRQARTRLGARGGALLGDVCAVPDEAANAEVMYARFLLTHLSEPEAALDHWLGRLARKGVLILEEVESIATEEPVLADYLELQRRMLAAGGQDLEVGPRIDRAVRTRAAVLTSEVAELTPPTRAAARLFAMNLANWRGRPVVAELASATELDRIARALERLAEDADSRREITWRLRQVIAARKR